MWDQIETDFGGDETVNFGPREEKGSALFQIETVATVSCTDPGNKYVPPVVSSILGDLTCLAIQKQLLVQTSTILQFDNEIEQAAWSPDGSILVIGDTAGMVYLLSAESGEIIFSYNLMDKSRKIGNRAFEKILFTDSTDLVILTSDGQLLVQSGLEALQQGGVDVSETIRENVSIITTMEQHSVVHDVVVLGNLIYTFGDGASMISVWQHNRDGIQLIDEVSSFLKDEATIRKAKGSTDGQYLFTLDDNNTLSLWSAPTLTCLRQWTDVLEVDFCLLEASISQNNSLQEMKIVLITTPNGDGVCSLKVLTLPQDEIIYQLQLEAPSSIATCHSNLQESLYIVEFCGNAEGQPDVYNSMRFRCLTETDPKTRLYKILQKNKFEEAEKFAQLFKLDIELVHKVKANYLIDQLSPWNVNKYCQQQLDEMTAQFWKCLGASMDDLDVAEKCLGASFPTLPGAQALIVHCLKRLDKVSASKDPVEKEKQQTLNTKALEVQHRLKTFELAFGEKEFSGEKWDQFRRACLLRTSLEQMYKGHLDTGFTIWMRHQISWTGSISIEMIQQILSCISYNTAASTVQCYLTTGLIPTVIREVPQALHLIVSFIIDKTKSLETVEKKTWPKEACYFANSLYSQLCRMTEVHTDNSTCMADERANKMMQRFDVVLEPLHTLISKLHQLDQVLHKYHCRLSLAQFLQETCETITFRMLDKVVALELITPTLERQIRPYMREHHLNQDQIFSKYIKDLLERSGRIRSYTEVAPWEAKACAILDCITDPEQKLDGILEVIKWAPIPWSSCVARLIQAGLQLKHPKVSKLKDERELLNVRTLMQKYCKKNSHFEVPQGHNAERLIYVILSRDTPECVTDALEVMKVCGLKMENDLYNFRLKYLINANKLGDAMSLFKSLPLSVSQSVGNSLLIYTSVVVNDTIMFPGLEDQIRHTKQQYTEAGIHIAKYLQGHIQGSLLKKEHEKKQKLLRNLLALQVEFDEYLTEEEYADKSYRLELMDKFVLKFYSKDSMSLKYAKVYRLADILQISQTTLLGQLIVKSVVSSNISVAVTFSKELCEMSQTEEDADTLYEVTHVLLHLLGGVEEEEGVADDVSNLRPLPDICDMMAKKAICICSPETIQKHLELYKSCSMLVSVNQQCEISNTMSDTFSDGFYDYSADTAIETGLSLEIFQEDALLMDSNIILPLVAKYTAFNPLCAEEGSVEEEGGGEKNAPEEQCAAVLPVIQYLKINGHLQLAFCFSVHLLNTLDKYTQQLDMGLPVHSQEQRARIEQVQLAVKGINHSSQVLLRDLVTCIVLKIFNGARPDESLALTYMSTRPIKEIHDVMMRLTKGAGQIYKRLLSVARMGVALGELNGDILSIHTCQVLELNASWGYRLGKLKIPFKSAFYAPNSEKQKLLPLIAQSEAADSNLVKEYCIAFELRVDDGLLLYVNNLLLSPEDGSNTGDLAKSSVLNKAKLALRQIVDKTKLADMLNKLFLMTGPYDYEKLQFLLEELENTDEITEIPVQKGLKLLEYLFAYTRHAPPSDYEMDYKPGGENKEMPLMMASLPPESRTRLPLHPILQGDPWKIITSELKKESISVWILTAKLLNLSHDQLCLTAVQNMVRSYAETYTSTDSGSDMAQWNWRNEAANTQLLNDTQSILGMITNCESSLACAKWMITKLPLGSEKVMVLLKCCDLAELWHRELPADTTMKNRAKLAYIKFLTHWQRMASAQVLCLNGLAEEELLQLTDKPDILLQKLFEHQSISQTQAEVGRKLPDIHKAAADLADINKLELGSVKSKLIQKWLMASCTQSDSDETMTFTLENLKFAEDSSDTENSENEDVNYKRIVHLLKNGTSDEIIGLMGFLLEPEEGSDLSANILGLRCILHLGNEVIKSVCNKSALEISQLIHVMTYLVHLENLHIRHTVETFNTCNKEGLVRGIWRNHNHEKTAVVVVSCICLDYKLFDKPMWSNILQRLVTFRLCKQLENVLLRLVTVPDIWSVPYFSKAWQYLITTALDKASLPLTEELTDSLVYHFNLLFSSCPVLHDLDMSSLCQQYSRLQLWACLIGCMILAADDTTQMIQKTGCQNILESVRKLAQHGFNHRLAVQVNESVYTLVNEQEHFKVVVDSRTLKEFGLFCVRQKTILPVLQFAIRTDRLKEAKTLFSVFTTHHQDILMKLSPFIDEEDEEEEDTQLMYLKAFLKMNELDDVAALLHRVKA